VHKTNGLLARSDGDRNSNTAPPSRTVPPEVFGRQASWNDTIIILSCRDDPKLTDTFPSGISR